MTALANLLPCPFCGGRDALSLFNTHTPSFWVECYRDSDGCGATAHGEYFSGPRRNTRFSYEPDAPLDDKLSARTLAELHPEYRKSAESAIAAWNRRATLSPAELGGVEKPVAWMIDAEFVDAGKVRAFSATKPNPDMWSKATFTPLYTTPRADDAVVDDAVYTEEEVAEAMEVLRGRHGSSALVDEVLDDMERVLRAALSPPSPGAAK